MTKVIFLNGPPRSGKDYSGALLAQHRSVACLKFAHAVKDGTHAAYGLVDDDGGPLEFDYFEDDKDKPCLEFFGRTPRECYIAYSEAFMKPLHGPRIFGELLLRERRYYFENTIPVAITDSGFRPEAEVLVEVVGAGNCFLVRLEKEGCSYAGDSRGRIDLSDLGVQQLDVVNPGTPGGLLAALGPVLEWLDS